MNTFLCTASEYARAVGQDYRSIKNKLPKPVAKLVCGSCIKELYIFPTFPTSAAIVVNLNSPSPSDAVAKAILTLN
jgi:hypothetical protein